jgi:predicted Zn-dependent protease
MRQMTSRVLSYAVCAALSMAIALSFAPRAAADGFFDRILGTPTYKSFKGKFIESQSAQDAIKAALAADAARVKGAEGHFVGSATWDGIPSRELHDYAQAIVDRLLAGWGGPHPKMRIWITADPGLEAESNSAGDLFLARGWFDEVESEDEVAAVLAHEIGHVLLGHFSRDEEHQRNLTAVSGAATAASTAFTIGSLRPQGSGTSATLGVGDQGKLNHQIRDAAMIKFAIDELSDVAINAPWAREQEDKADLLGIDLLYRANYNVLAMRDVLQRLAAYEKTADQKVDTLAITYDDTLKQSLESGDRQTMITALTDKAGIWLWSTMNSANDRFVRAHPDTQARLDDVAKYIGREYEDDQGPKPNVASLKKILADKAVHAILADHADAAQASGLTDAKDRSRRLSMATRAARQGGSSAPFPLRVMAQSLNDSGSSAKALGFYRRAANSADASFATMTMLAGAYANARDFAKADGVLDEAVARFGSREAVYPMRIMVDLKQGDQKGADAVLQQCLGVQNEGLAKQCKTAHGDDCDKLECRFKGGTNELKAAAPKIGH